MKDLPRGEITRLTTAWKASQKQNAALTRMQGNVDENDHGTSPVVSHFASACLAMSCCHTDKPINLLCWTQRATH